MLRVQPFDVSSKTADIIRRASNRWTGKRRIIDRNEAAVAQDCLAKRWTERSGSYGSPI